MFNCNLIGSVSKSDQKNLSEMTDSTQTMAINDNRLQLYSAVEIITNINVFMMINYLIKLWTDDLN